MTEKKLLFIPVYNCEKQIIRVLKKIEPVQTIFDEILVVNNRSADDSEKMAIKALKENLRYCGVTVLRNRDNYGLGGSHKVAFNYAAKNNFDYCLVLHGDDQGDINDIIPELASGAHRDYDCLLNSRFMPGAKRIGYSKIRTIGNIAFNVLFSLATGRRQYDLGSGLCCYRRQFFENKFLQYCSDDLTFNYTLQLHAAAINATQKFFPSTWTEDDQVSNVKLFSQTLQMINILWSYVIRRKKFLTTRKGRGFEGYEADTIYSRAGK
jgi:glycosyltransferase involved in cell wall biosynthesis